jgi:hypothetical protein
MDHIVTFEGSAYRAIYSDKVQCTATYLRQLFNEGEYWYRATVENEFELDYPYEEPVDPTSDLPSGTISQIVIYHIRHQFFVRVHQLLLPYGEVDRFGRPRLGGYEEPDPKDLIEDAVWYTLPPRKVPKFVRRREAGWGLLRGE